MKKEITVDIELAKSLLTFDEAIELLQTFKSNRKMRVHSFISTSFALMGCDMDLSEVKKCFKKALKTDLSYIRIAGPQALSMGHGVAFFEENRGWTFIETKTEKINELLKIRKINYE